MPDSSWSNQDGRALVDSGAAGNFMDIALAEQLKIPLQPMNNQLRIKALDGRPLGAGTVTKQTPDIDLQRWTSWHETHRGVASTPVLVAYL
ncbi:hypothetical protein SRHO_G00340770 [Serrasalmus rhombeus]